MKELLAFTYWERSVLDLGSLPHCKSFTQNLLGLHAVRLNRNKITLKKFFVDPESKVPYWISVCFARSSADSIGVNILSTVKKAARLAV